LHGTASSKSSASASLRKKASASNVLRPVPTNATDIASILRRTYYQIPSRGHGKNNHSTHQPESLDWFNVLLAQTIAQYRQTAYNLRDDQGGTPSILASLEAAINDPDKRPSFIDKIKITEISMGEEFPIFSNVRVMALEDEGSNASGGRLQALMDVDLSDDNLTLAIETALILNYPKPFSAVLPVALAVSVVRFSGTLSISFVPATEDDPSEAKQSSPGKPKTNLAFSFLPDYRLDLSVRSLIGSRTRLQDVPKIAQLVEARAQAWFEERVVEPRVQVVPLPGLWPRMGKTRVREGQDDDRPVTQDDHRAPSFLDHRKEMVPDDNFPSQEEAERLIQGLRLRTGHQRSDSEVIEHEEDAPTPQPVRVMPGSMPT
jgi:maintenance of mitochondrial morphology protein 1